MRASFGAGFRVQGLGLRVGASLSSESRFHLVGFAEVFGPRLDPAVRLRALERKLVDHLCRGSGCASGFISQKVFAKSFCRIRFPHKPVN